MQANLIIFGIPEVKNLTNGTEKIKYIMPPKKSKNNEICEVSGKFVIGCSIWRFIVVKNFKGK